MLDAEMTPEERAALSTVEVLVMTAFLRFQKTNCLISYVSSTNWPTS